MKKTKLLLALVLCTAVSLNTCTANAETHETNVAEVINKTYDGYITPGDGGAITNTISSVVKDSTFTNNRAESNGSGGAIDLNTTVDTLTQIINSNFDNNYSNWSGGAVVQRRNAGKIDITGGSFTNNTTEYEGGAIFFGAEANVTSSIDNVVFEGNKTLSTTFNDKYSTADDGGGGAIFVGSAAHVTINNSDFNKNTSNTVGGAIAVRNDSKNNGSNSLSITNSNFTGNEALKDGGAIASFIDFNISDTTFEGNKSGRYGGAISLDLGNPKAEDSKSSTFENVTVTNNTAVMGGGIYNGPDSSLNITNSTISSNNAQTGGGIMHRSDGTLNISGSIFENNMADIQGGAISNAVDTGLMSIDGSFFNNNKAATGGGVANYSDVKITNSSFTENFASDIDDGGGAVFAGSVSSTYVENSTLTNNSTNGGGGAIATRGSNYYEKNGLGTLDNSNGKLDVINSTFTGNKALANNDGNGGNGGAIYNTFYHSQTNENSATIIGSTFENNQAINGGAVYNSEYMDKTSSTVSALIDNNVFNGNSATENGGAVYNAADSKISNSTFVNNNAGINGGAIASLTDTVITDSSFTNNSAGSKGGAVWANQNLTVNAVNSDIVMSGNTASDGGDIFMNTENSNLTMNAAEGKSITVASGISGNENGYNMLVNSNGGTGSLIINSAIQNAAIEVQNGTFHLAQGSALNNSTLNMASGTTLNTINNQVSSFGDNVTLQDNVNLAVDVNLANGKADNFAGADVQGKVTITDVNPLGSAAANGVSINLAEALGIDPNNMAISESLQNQTQRILTPIRYLQGGISETGMLTMAPTGNSYKDFNPAVMASPVAAQLGGYLTQLNSYDEAFRNMDMYMLMTKKQREAMKLRNKYAAADSNLIFDPTGTPYNDKAVWVRPYATFENVHLKGGPGVSNVAYGSFFGGESELYDLGHGWDGMYGIYAGYNGSHQAYDGIGIYQNGGTLGLVGMAYKGNYFIGATINAGANVGEASTAYGTDNFTMLMAGIAAKTGYNWELADGKFIIQPNFLMSYSFVNTFDYTNAAGVRMNSDPLNAIQFEPGIKFIGNLKNGWQPYAGVSVVWNIMDKTNFHANNVSLPELSVKPYVRYGVGVRKTWGEVCTGFLQTYFTNGGRNGVGLQAGFRFTLGKGGLSSIKASNNMPELPATKIMLSNGGR